MSEKSKQGIAVVVVIFRVALSLVSSPDRKDRHGSGADEEGGVGRHLKLHTAAHPPAEEVGGYQIDQGHVDQNARRHRVEQPLHHQRSWAVGVEGRRDAGPRRDPRRRRDGEEARHESRSQVVELRLVSSHVESRQN